MKTIGLIGGMSWESTATYYRLINEGIKKRCGGFHSAKMILYSVDFAEIEALQAQGCWHDAGIILSDGAARLQDAGAECLIICTNTMHKVADQVAGSVSIPLLHIADATAERVVEDGIKRIGLLGTAFTMEQNFYRGRLERRYGLEVIVPDDSDRKIVHDVIFKELCLGHILEKSREEYLRIARTLLEKGTEAIILGCTEIALLLPPGETELRLYDTTTIHAERAVQEMLGSVG